MPVRLSTLPYFYDEDVEKFVQWLETGISNYKK